MAADSAIYPYTPDDSKLFQICDKRMREITSLIGEELQPSIWLGEVTNPAYKCVSTTLMGIGGTCYPAWHYDAIEWHRRSNTKWGLCTDYNLQYYLNSFEWNKQMITMRSNKSTAFNWSFAREQFNSQRWTNKDSVYSADDYGYRPIVKLNKGSAVACFVVGAYKDPPDNFVDFNAYYSWVTNPSSYWNGSPEAYESVKTTYPNILAITMTVYCGATAGGSRTIPAVLFYPQDCKAVENDISMWNGEEFSQSYQYGDPLVGGRMSYGVIPQSAKVFNYIPTAHIFSGVCSNVMTNTEVVNNTNTGWTVRLGLEGTDRVKYISMGGSRRVGFMTFTDFDPANLVDLATSMGLAATNSSSNVAQNGSIENDSRIWVPTYNDNGDIDGKTNNSDDKTEYVEAGINGETIQPNFNPEEEEDEDPIPEEDPSEDQKTPEIDLPNVSLTSYGVFHKTYVMTKSQCQSLSDYLWNPDPDTFSAIIQDLKLVGDNVMNSIISVVMFPFEIPHSDDPAIIRIGRRNTTVSAPLLDTSNFVFEMGTCYCYPQFKNFLDYEPYTKGWLYIPFCGLFEIPLQQFMNKYIDIKLAVDLLTGAGLAIVYAGGIPILYKNCKIGMQIPVTGADSTYTTRNYINAVESAFSGLGNALAGNPLGAIGNVASATLSCLTAKNAPITCNGSNSPQCGILAPNKCYFIIERPKTIMSQNPDYGKLIGYACYKTNVIGNFSGFTTFDNVKLSISQCTDNERNEIISLLRSGVYL